MTGTSKCSRDLRVASRVVVALPVLLVGGTEVHTLRLVRALIAAGYDVSVCCYYESDPTVVSWFEEAGASVMLLGRKRGEALTRLLAALIRTFRELRPDVIHVQYLAPGLIPIVAARIARVRKVLATVHIAGTGVYGTKAKLLLRTAAALCDAFVCVSKGVERYWFGRVDDRANGRRGRRRHFTIYNAVDVEVIRRAAESGAGIELKRQLDGPVVGVVGRLTAQKGVDLLLRALPLVARSIPRVNLVVVGDGADRGDLERSASELGVSERVTWLGRRSPEYVHELYGAFDVLAVPSRYEGFGLVAAEAMAAGVAVVGSDVDGISEVVENGVTGLLVPAGDVAGLAGALVELLGTPGSASDMGMRGRQRAREHFSAERFDREVTVAYGDLLMEGTLAARKS